MRFCAVCARYMARNSSQGRRRLQRHKSGLSESSVRTNCICSQEAGIQIGGVSMGTEMPKVLLVAESPQGCSYLAQRLQERGCHCEVAASYPETCSLLRIQHFDLVLSPMRLRDKSLFPLIDLLDGSAVTLFFSHAVEQGCWWLPALHHGERCFGSAALRPSEFVTALDDAIEKLRRDGRVAGNTRQFSVCQSGIFVMPLSRCESRVGPLPAKASIVKRKAAG